MSAETIEVGAIILAAIAVALAVIRLAWWIIEEIVNEIRYERQRRAVMVGSRYGLHIGEAEPGVAYPAITHTAIYVGDKMVDHHLGAFDWPEDGENLESHRSVEPVRQSFRSMLEGGPDYRG